MERDEQALRLYEITHALMTERIKLRDGTLLFYATVAGGAFSLALQGSFKEAVVAIPLLSLACGTIMAYQSFMIEAIFRYFDTNL